MAKDNNNVFQWILVSAIVLLVVFLLFNMFVKPQCQSQNNLNTDKNKISVTGAYTEDIQPNEAKIYITISSKNMNGETAQTENAQAANNIIKVIKSFNIDKDNIETSDFSVQINREWNSIREKYEEKGIIVTNSIVVTLKDFTKIGNLVDSITPAGTVGTTITEINNIQFGLTKERENEVKQELLSKASKNAKQKAEAIADSLNVNIVGVITASESNVYIPYARYDSALLSKSAESSAPTPINPQQITTTANVLVEFEIA